MKQEPVAYSAGVIAIVEAIIPVLMIFGIIDWTIEQAGAVVLAVGVVAKTLGAWFARSRVTPV